MKKKVKQYNNQIKAGALDRRHVLKDFSRMLDNQVRIWGFCTRISYVHISQIRFGLLIFTYRDFPNILYYKSKLRGSPMHLLFF